MKKIRNIFAKLILSVTVFLATNQVFADVPNSNSTCTIGTCGTSQECDESCQCLVPYILDNDGEEIFSDSDPKKDDSSKFEITFQEPETNVLDSSESEFSTIVDVYDKTYQEIYEDEYAKLNKAEKWLFRALQDSSHNSNEISPPAEIPVVENGNPVLAGLVSSGHLHGFYTLKPPNESIADFYYLDFGSKHCYYKGWRQITPANLGIKVYPKCKGEGCYMELAFCVPSNWMNGDPYKQLVGYYEKPWSTDALDLVVGMTPFLGTADLIYNNLEELKNGDLKVWGETCASAAGDIWALGKIGAAIKGGAKLGKAWHVASFLSGCGSVSLTGAHLYSEFKNDQWDSENWGQTAFLAIEIIGLITDRKAHDIISKSVRQEAIKQKLPQAICGCIDKCALTFKSPIQTSKQKVGDVINLVRTLKGRGPWKGTYQYGKKVWGHILGDFTREKPRKLTGGGHRRGGYRKDRAGKTVGDGVQPWVDDLLDPNNNYIDPDTKKSIRDTLFDHLGVPQQNRSQITGYDSLFEWCSATNSSTCGVHPNGVKYISYPKDSWLNERAYNDTLLTSQNQKCGSLRGYPPGGKTIFPDSWDEKKIKEAADAVLNSPSNNQIPLHNGIAVEGTYEGVKIRIVLSPLNDIPSIFPVWNQ